MSGWIKPNDLLKQRTKASRVPAKRPAVIKRRRNPFSKENIPPHIDLQNGDEVGNISLTPLADKLQVSSKPFTHTPKLIREIKRCLSEDSPAVAKSCSKELPLTDLCSLKCRIRFTSSVPFDPDLFSEPGNDRSSDLLQLLRYYSYPHLPWLRLFPRYGLSDNSNSDTTTTTLSQTQPICDQLFAQAQESVYSEWKEVFTNLFDDYRAGNVPYFYFCCNSFTVLFDRADNHNNNNKYKVKKTALNSSESSQSSNVDCNDILDKAVSAKNPLRVSMTPSTRGLRELLTKAHLNFTLPYSCIQVVKTSTEGDKDGLSSEGSPILRRDDARSFLQDLGIDRCQIRSEFESALLNSNSNVDGRTESTLLFESERDVAGMFNFLINYKQCIPTWGKYAGVPPTLLAAQEFTGATVGQLKTSSKRTKTRDSHETSESSHHLDISGPLLRSNVLSISRHVADRHFDDFNVSISVLDYTMGLNCTQDAVADLKMPLKFNFVVDAGFTCTTDQN